MAYLSLGIVIGFVLGFLVGLVAGRRKSTVPLGGEAELAGQESSGSESIPPGISLVVNGRTVDVPAAAMAEIQDLIKAKRKIDAIKTLRESSALGLAEAKAVMESLEKVIR